MPATKYGIDVGSMLRDVEAIKGARAANVMAGQQIREAEEAERMRPVIAGARQEAAMGDEDAQRRLLALDPKGAPAFIDALSKMDDRARARTQQNVDQMGRMAHYVLQGGDDAERAKRYERMRTNLAPEVAERLPPRYDEPFMRVSLAKAQTMDQMLQAPTVRGIGGEQVAYRAGLEEERAPIPTKPTGKGAAGGMKSSDEALMYRMAGGLLGGIFDQEGNLTNLDPQTRNRVQSITTEASRIFAKGKKTRAESVKEAANKFGFDVKKAPGDNPRDPQNIRKYLMQQ